MLRLSFLCILFLFSTSAFAQSVIVHGSIYMVMSPATPHYFSNIAQVQAAVKNSGYPVEERTFELSHLSFLSAQVVGPKVTYSYYLSYETANRGTCILGVTIVARNTTTALESATADFQCHEWED